MATWFLTVLCFVVCLQSCGEKKENTEAQLYNDLAYSFNYVNLDSVVCNARKAYDLAGNSVSDKAEALNNLAFVDIIKMKYKDAQNKLDSVFQITDNQLELLVADVLMMRICQRQSGNKQFYDYYWQAKKIMSRIEEDFDTLSPRQKKRYIYASTEFSIILSAYLYYLGQINESIEALNMIDENGVIQQDKAQMLNYYYNIGYGSVLKKGTAMEIAYKEMEYLYRCYFIANKSGMPYWVAKSLQAMSEHLQNPEFLDYMYLHDPSMLMALNSENVDLDLLAGNLAQRSVELFTEYGDVYQTAGALRTLSDCFAQIDDYYSAIDCLHSALETDSLINEAPDLVSSIRERLSICYSAVDDKQHSDINRNIYLDLQDQTRQNRELEARAEQLSETSTELSFMIVGVCVLIVVLLFLLLLFTRMRSKKEKEYSVESMLQPLEDWQKNEMQKSQLIREEYDEIVENQESARLLCERNLRTNLEQRAKMSLVNSITPFIDRILAEITCLNNRNEPEEVRMSRYEYIMELTDYINKYNKVLTDWIQLRKGELNLKIESFPLQDLFDIVKRGQTTFNIKGLDFIVHDSKLVVKADKTLTLFMINTIADNARKFTPEGGVVEVGAVENADSVDIFVSDNGQGMNQEQLDNVFNHQPSASNHGFGLMNCKGIIEKYRKVSSLFSVCSIVAESKQGEGSKFTFRLPKGIIRGVVLLLSFLSVSVSFADETQNPNLKNAAVFVEKAYNDNIAGQYEKAIADVDSVCTYYNLYYRQEKPHGSCQMVLLGEDVETAAELRWYRDSLRLDYNLIMSARNEAAVAALALHEWDLYRYNNKIFNRLYSEVNADHKLSSYVEQMQHASEAKNVAIILLVLLLVSILPAYYLLYYRHRVYFRLLVDRVNNINGILQSELSDDDKLSTIRQLWKESGRYISGNKNAEALDSVVEHICAALDEKISVSKRELEEIELAQDELRRVQFESDRLYVNNNVLDNCFSTLKHETMYYPSRIRQLLAEEELDLKTLTDLTFYYKEIYTLLSMQAQNQVESNIKLDERISSYIVFLLKRITPDKTVEVLSSSADGVYVRYVVSLPALQLSDEKVADLFTPLTSDLQCLILRQIIREIGEVTNCRACGIQAARAENGGTNVEMTLTKNIKLKI